MNPGRKTQMDRGQRRQESHKERRKSVIIALATEDDKGLEATLSQHFGRCPYYIVVSTDGEEATDVKTVQSPFFERHGQPGEVPNFIKGLGADVIIAGGMGPKAIGFFTELGIEAITGASGRVSDVLKDYFKGQLRGASACADHDLHHGSTSGHDEASRLREDIGSLRRDLAEAMQRLSRLEQKKGK